MQHAGFDFQFRVNRGYAVQNPSPYAFMPAHRGDKRNARRHAFAYFYRCLFLLPLGLAVAEFADEDLDDTIWDVINTIFEPGAHANGHELAVC